jgi:hypothetical protein
VNRVSVNGVTNQVARGPRDMFKDDLEFERQYVLARRPSAPEITSDALAAYCREFRDFDQLVSGDGLIVMRGLELMDIAKLAAAKGRFPFPVTCTDQVPENGRDGVPCEAARVLGALDMKDIRQVSETERHDYGRSETWWWKDSVYVPDPRVADIDGHPVGWSFDFESEHITGQRRLGYRIRSLTITRWVG